MLKGHAHLLGMFVLVGAILCRNASSVPSVRPLFPSVLAAIKIVFLCQCGEAVPTSSARRLAYDPVIVDPCLATCSAAQGLSFGSIPIILALL